MRFGVILSVLCWAHAALAAEIVVRFDDGGEARLLSFDGTVVVSEEYRDGEVWRYRSHYGAVDLTIDGPGLKIRPVDGSPSPLLLTEGAGGRYELARIGAPNAERLVQDVTVGGLEEVQLPTGMICARIVDVRVTWDAGGFAQRRFWIVPAIGYYVKVLGAEFLPGRPVEAVETTATEIVGMAAPVAAAREACPAG